MKNVALLGSTGSIGIQAEKIIKANPSDFRPVALAARGGNIDILARQTVELRPVVVAVFDESAGERLKGMVPASVKVLTGMDGILEICNFSGVDTVLNSMVGMVGLRPTLETLNSNKTLLLANKESLVAGGELVMELLDRGLGQMLPVDSEHSGLYMCGRGGDHAEIETVTIYASGGPFRGKKREDLKDVTAEQAGRHPTWSMGKIITIQSSTLSNKGREVIEAMWMYRLRPEQIDVLVERTSTFHATMHFQDGTVMAQMASPSMEIPIQYALYYPKRPRNEAKRLRLSGREIAFEEPDRDTFPALRLAEVAAVRKRTMPAVFNGADEMAVNLFIEGKIKFLDMGDIVTAVMRSHKNDTDGSLNAVLEADRWAREEVVRIAAELKR